jgi:hypothetical protein
LRDAAEAAREQIELGIKSTVKDGDATKKTALTKSELAKAEKDRLKRLKDIAEAEYAQASRLEAAKATVDAIAASYKAMDQAALDAANADAEARQASIGAVDTSFNGPTDGGQPLAGGGNAPTIAAEPIKLGVDISTIDALTEAMKTLRNTFGDFGASIEQVNDIYRRFGKEAGDAAAAALAKTKEGIAALKKLWKDVAGDIAGSVINVFGAVSDNQTEKELANLEKTGAARIAAAQGNADLQAKIRADLDAQEAQIQKKAAARQKKLALAEAIINTAVAVTKAIASAPPPFNIPAIVSASIAGAAQIAIIAAHAKGTNDAPGGLSLVGEKGPELINLPPHYR